MKKRRYEKPTLKIIKVELSNCIAASGGQVLKGDNINTAFGGNGYHNKDITVDKDQDLTGTWDSSWNNSK